MARPEQILMVEACLRLYFNVLRGRRNALKVLKLYSLQKILNVVAYIIVMIWIVRLT